jgi:hypothetical protein
VSRHGGATMAGAGDRIQGLHVARPWAVTECGSICARGLPYPRTGARTRAHAWPPLPARAAKSKRQPVRATRDVASCTQVVHRVTGEVLVLTVLTEGSLPQTSRLFASNGDLKVGTEIGTEQGGTDRYRKGRSVPEVSRFSGKQRTLGDTQGWAEMVLSGFQDRYLKPLGHPSV